MSYQQNRDLANLLKESENIAVAPPPVAPPQPKVSATPKKAAASSKHTPANVPFNDPTKVERTRLRRIINEYVASKSFGAALEEAGFQKIDMHASEKKSIEELQAILEEIKVTIQKDNKTKFVRNMAKNGMEALGGILVATTKQMEFAKLASVMDDDADFFEPELEEMAIEMDPSYIPGPKARFMFKLGSLIYKVYQETEMYQNQKYESLNKKKSNPPPS